MRGGAVLALACLACSPAREEVSDAAQVQQPVPAYRVAEAPMPVTTEWLLSPEGLGPLRIGMTLDEASTALGTRLVTANISDDPEICDQLSPEGDAYPGLSTLTEHNRIAYVTLFATDEGSAPAYRTVEGIGLGSTGEQVRAAYGGGLQRETQPYTGEPNYDLYLWQTPNRGMRFQVNEEGRVFRIFVGDDSIRYMEGCL